MLLRVLVDIGDDVPELTVRCDGHTPEGMLKQTTCPIISVVNGFGIGVEEVGELLTQVIIP